MSAIDVLPPVSMVTRSVRNPPGGPVQSTVCSQGAAGGRGQRGGSGAQLRTDRPPPRHRGRQRVAGRLPAAGGTDRLGRLGGLGIQSEQSIRMTDILVDSLLLAALNKSINKFHASNAEPVCVMSVVVRETPRWTAAPLTAPPPSTSPLGGAPSSSRPS